MAGKPPLLMSARSGSAGAYLAVSAGAGSAWTNSPAAAADNNFHMASPAAALHDAGHCLQEYISSLDNLPAEIAYHFAELRTKDEEIQQLRESIYLAEQELRRRPFSTFGRSLTFGRSNGYCQISKHISRLDADIGKFGEEVADQQTVVIANKENTFQQTIVENTPRARPAVERPLKKVRKRLPRAAEQVVVAATDGEWKSVEAIPGDGDVADNTPWCYCREPSRGQLIGCDDPECQYAWYHTECVGLKEIPSGSWYCAVCLDRRKEGS